MVEKSQLGIQDRLDSDDCHSSDRKGEIENQNSWKKEKEKGKGREDSMEGSTTPEINGLNGLNGGPNGISGSDTSIKPDQNGIEKTDVVISVA